MKATTLFIVGAFALAVLCPCSQSSTVSRSKSPLTTERKITIKRKLAEVDFDRRTELNQPIIVGVDKPGFFENGQSFGLSLAVFLMGFVWSIVQDTRSSVFTIHGGQGGELELISCLAGIPLCYFIHSNLARKLSYKVSQLL